MTSFAMLGDVVATTEHGGGLAVSAAIVCLFATAVSGIRWLRVAQREHYLPDSASRFAIRWWTTTPLNGAASVVAIAGLVLGSRWPVSVFASAVVVASGPAGLGLRGRTSPLSWTRRLRTLAGTWVLFQVVVAVVGFVTGYPAVFCAAGALAVPALVDVACVATGPLERRIAERYVRQARQRLDRVRPKIVAITGSYGKTSTKGYVTHLLDSTRFVVASPASFNNRAGLARAVNEHLAQGTDVFVAEMGTYGPGEIAELCSWMTPDVAVVTAIGPVHLERFKSEDKIVEAKSEILEKAPACVLNVDDPRLAALADKSESEGKRVWRVSSRETRDDESGARANSSRLAPQAYAPKSDVVVVYRAGTFEVLVRGERIAEGVAKSARPGNVACAVAVAMELGVEVGEIARQLDSLPVAPHRLEPQLAEGGFTVLDDTYNSNPAGARAAIELLAASAPVGRRKVLVTPGMVELGAVQAKENEDLASEAARAGAELVVVGRTNRRSLLRGFGSAVLAGAGPAVVVDRREEAVEWVRQRLEPGDFVLYENDLPDHYP